MGLIKAAAGSVGGVLADQWKEFFTCDALGNNVLLARGAKQGDRRSSNRGNDNIISRGSAIAVADGQCAIVVDQGVVTEVAAEPGVFTYDASAEPSLFTGGLDGDNIRAVFRTMWERFKYGGATGRDQRVYYFNLKEIMDNKFGTPSPIPFRIVDRNTGIDADLSVRCNGIFTFKITNPISFYANVAGNAAEEYTTDQLKPVLKSEFVGALNPAFARLSELSIRPYELPSHVDELCEEMNRVLSAKWNDLRGLSIVSVSINSVTLPDEDAAKLKNLQFAVPLRDPVMAAAQLTQAQAEAMRAAASNEAGAMAGFMGMGMAQGLGGGVAADLFRMKPGERAAARGGAASWTCACGAVNSGKFCSECGQPRPAAPAPAGAGEWTCACGAVNSGKFCSECGQPRPAAPRKCGRCGFVLPDGAGPMKFCPECGAPLNGAG